MYIYIYFNVYIKYILLKHLMVIVPFLQYDYCIVCHSGLNNMNNNQLSHDDGVRLF